MTATERARRSDSLYYDTRVTNRRALCDMIANLESDLEEYKAKSASLQMLNETLMMIANNVSTHLNTANEELRKLVHDLLNAWDDVQRETITGPTFDECERRAYELGIEVDG